MVGVEFETRRRLSRQLPQLCLLQVFRVCEVFNLVLSDLRETSEGTSGGLGHQGDPSLRSHSFPISALNFT